MSPKTKIICKIPWSHHHSGWPYVVCGLRKHLHNDMGTNFFTNAIVPDIFQSDEIMTRPWVGVLHAPPTNEIQSLLNRETTKKSLKSCHGIYVLSDHLKSFVSNNTNVLCESFRHPVSPPKYLCNLEACLTNKKIVMVGHWMRRFESIYKVQTSFQKAILRCTNKKHDNSVEIIPYLKEKEYEDFISTHIVFLDLIDASANNTIIECIVRNTPVVVNRLPSVVEHLGENYPLLFDNLSEVDGLLTENNIVEAHNHLKSLDKSPYKIESMIDSILASEIYQSLPDIPRIMI